MAFLFTVDHLPHVSPDALSLARHHAETQPNPGPHRPGTLLEGYAYDADGCPIPDEYDDTPTAILIEVTDPPMSRTAAHEAHGQPYALLQTRY